MKEKAEGNGNHNDIYIYMYPNLEVSRKSFNHAYNIIWMVDFAIIYLGRHKYGVLQLMPDK